MTAQVNRVTTDISRAGNIPAPRVSIIIPVLNKADALDESICSVTEQKFKSVELIVIDGGSKDGTADVIRKFESHLQYYISENDLGIYDAMNKGIDHSHGEWLLFLGADDRLAHPDVLKNIFSKDHCGHKLLYGDVQYTNRKVHRSSFGPALYFKNVLHHQGVFYHRNCFAEYRFNTSLAVLGDYELNLKLFRYGIPGNKEPFRAKRVDSIVSLCGTNGISKHYLPSLYHEEWKIKKEWVPFPVRPVAMLSIWLKFLIKYLWK